MTQQEEQGSEEERRKALFALLTEEIKDLNEAYKLQGWTPWILSATLISMAWLVVQDLWSENAQIASIHAIFLVVTLELFLVLFLKGMFEDEDTKGPFEFLHTRVPAFSALTTTTWFTTVAIACIRLEGVHYLLFITGVIFGLLALFGLIIVIAIATRFPLPVTRSASKWTSLSSLIFCLIYGIDVVILTQTDAFAIARVSDIRAGGLLALGAYALVVLSRPQSRKIQKTLIELRRDLILGNIELPDAEHQARRELQGLWLSDVFRDDIHVLENLVSEVRTQYADAFSKIERLKASVPLSHANGPLRQVEKEAVAKTLDDLALTEKAVHEISSKYHKRVRWVLMRLGAARLAKGWAAENAKLLAEIERVRRPADEELRRFAQEFSEIQLAWNRWYPNETRQYQPFASTLETHARGQARSEERKSKIQAKLSAIDQKLNQNSTSETK